MQTADSAWKTQCFQQLQLFVSGQGIYFHFLSRADPSLKGINLMDLKPPCKQTKKKKKRGEIQQAVKLYSLKLKVSSFLGSFHNIKTPAMRITLRWKLKHLSFPQMNVWRSPVGWWLSQGFSSRLGGPSSSGGASAGPAGLGEGLHWGRRGVDFPLSVSSFTKCLSWGTSSTNTFPSGRTECSSKTLQLKQPGKRRSQGNRRFPTVWDFWLPFCSHLLSSCSLWLHPLIPAFSFSWFISVPKLL